MKRLIKILAICMVMIAAFNSFALAKEVDLDAKDAIIAVVNDEVITLKDLRDYIHQTYVSLVAQGMADEDLQGVMRELEANGLEKLIEDKLILSRANAMGIEVRDKLVDQRMEEIKVKYESEQIFMDALVKNGATVTDLRNKILEQFKIKYIVEHEIKSKIFINPQEVTEFYEGHRSDFQKPQRLNLDSIYVAFVDDASAARNRVKEAEALIKEGKDFSEVAKKYSDTPSIGIVEEGQLIPLMEEVVLKLSQNEVSSPVETDKGIYIFKLNGKIAAETADIKEVKAQIYDVLFLKKFQTRFNQWLDKLKSKAYVEIKS